MSPGRMHRVLQQLRVAAQRTDAAERPDADLLRLFIEARDEAAFTTLVRRHAAMVLGVCRRVTGDPHDADDAFQAAFCVLLRKAASIRRREVLGSWLYGVAYRTALAAKARRAKTRRREHQVDAMPQPLQSPPEANHDWQPLLDAALDRLPERFRTPIVLCDLEGKSRKEAALQLHLSEGTLSSRLARGRRLLAQRLQRHGLTLSGGALAALLAEQAAAANVPATLIHTVAQVGAQMILGAAPAALAVSHSVLALTEGVMKAMLLGKLKSCMVILLTCAALAAGGFWLTDDGAAQTPASDTAPANPTPTAPSAKQPTALLDWAHSAQNCAACHRLDHHAMQRDPHGFAAQPQFRIEAALSIGEFREKAKPTALPTGVVPMGQRMSFGIDGVLERPGKPQVSKYSWTVEIIRQRGSDVLVHLTLEKKERQSSALVHGSSVEFEDFIPLNAWKTVTDQAWSISEFKIKVSAVDTAPPPIPPAKAPASGAAKKGSSAANPLAAPTTGEGAETSIYRLKHLLAGKAANTVKELFADAQHRNISISVDDRTNSLILRAQPNTQALVNALLNNLDVPAAAPPAAADGAGLRIFRLRHVQAADARRSLQKMLPPADRPDLRIVVDEGTNSLFVATNPAEMDKVAAAIGKIDVADAPPTTPVQPGAAANQPGAAPAAPASAVSPDGMRLAVTSKDDVLTIDVRTGKVLFRSVSDAVVNSLAFSPDGKLLASGTGKGTVHLYDAATGKKVRQMKNEQAVTRIEFAVDGQTKLTVLLVNTTEPAVRVWDLTTGKLLRVERGQPEKK